MNYEDRVTKEYVEGLLAGVPKIVTGSYTGTGEYGEEHRITLTFDFVPKMVIVSGREYYQGSTTMIIAQGATRARNICLGSSSMKSELVLVRCEGNSVSWYCTSGSYPARCMANEQYSVYDYIAFG